MLYSDLADTFERLESTSSRLEMTTILADFLRGVDTSEIRDIVYLCQGKVHPDFVPGVFGMSDKLVLEALEKQSGYPKKKVNDLWIKTGDPGQVAEQVLGRKIQKDLFSFGDDADDSDKDMEISGIVRILRKMETDSAQDSKKNDLIEILKMVSPKGARYICRLVTGRMRIGAGDMTILDALAEAFATKEDRPAIERAFNVTCDIGLIAETIATGGMDAISTIHVSVGNPVKVMLAERLPSVSEIVERMGGRCAIEYKYDGIRVQAHIGRDGVRLFSRRLEDLTNNFPDIARMLRSRCKHDEAIIEGECVAVDPETGFMLPFQNVTHRRRKNDMESAIEKVPVRIFMFDILYHDGEDLTNLPYPER
ncbi:MAG: ATP-dependent DNA ligase, partial [Candidatus Methanomethylophilaceae archaeon]|nr:ATP-dependent DNA ligase [Candidatus Methanomethylophilaceae archaeon]